MPDSAAVEPLPAALAVSVVSAVHSTFLQGLAAGDRAVLRRGLLDCADRLAPRSLVASWAREGREVALVGDHRIARVERADLGREMRLRPRTRVLEGVQSIRGSWAALAAAHLARMCRRRVSISLYESDRADAGSGWHHDQFDGVVVQVRGTKVWEFESGSLATSAGDVMAIPFGVGHAVATPDHSAHLLVAYLPEPLLPARPRPPGHQTGAEPR